MLTGDFTPKYRVTYTRGDGGHTFEEVVEVNAFTTNQALIKIKDEPYKYKRLDFKDINILGIEKVESWND